MTNEADRRKGLRVQIKTEIYIVPDIKPDLKGVEDITEPTTFDAQTVNISDGGAYLESQPMPEQGDIAILVFIYPGRRNPIVLQAKVAWLNNDNMPELPNGFGVEFIFTSKEQEAGWKQFMEMLIDIKSKDI